MMMRRITQAEGQENKTVVQWAAPTALGLMTVLIYHKLKKTIRHTNIDDLLKSSDDERDADDSVVILDYNEEDSDELLMSSHDEIDHSQGDPYRRTEARPSRYK